MLSARQLYITLAPSIFVLLAMLATTKLLHVSIPSMTRDVTAIAKVHPLIGVLSNPGILLWCATAKPAVFTGGYAPDKMRDNSIMNVKHFLFSIALIIPLLSTGCGGKAQRLHYEKSGGFSYDPPPGWQVVEFPGLKYKISHGPEKDGFSANINVTDEFFPGSLNEYVEINLANLKKVMTGLRILGREDIITRDNEPAVKLVVLNKQQQFTLRQTFLFIGSGEKKFVVTYTALSKDGDMYDEAFLQCMKSFRMH